MRRATLLLLSALLGWTMALGLPNANAATNRALGGIGGIDNGTLIGGDGTGDASITLESMRLALVKQARDENGNVLADNAEVTPGQTIWFVLSVDNPTNFPASEIEISDLLDEAAFTYIPGSIATATAPSGTDPWIATWTTKSDAPGAPDDEASIIDTGGPPGADSLTIGAASGQPNVPVTLPANTVLAVRFSVTVN